MEHEGAFRSSARAEDKPRVEDNCTQHHLDLNVRISPGETVWMLLNLVLNLYFEVKSI